MYLCHVQSVRFLRFGLRPYRHRVVTESSVPPTHIRSWSRRRNHNGVGCLLTLLFSYNVFRRFVVSCCSRAFIQTRGVNATGFCIFEFQIWLNLVLNRNHGQWMCSCWININTYFMQQRFASVVMHTAVKKTTTIVLESLSFFYHAV